MRPFWSRGRFDLIPCLLCNIPSVFSMTAVISIHVFSYVHFFLFSILFNVPLVFSVTINQSINHGFTSAGNFGDDGPPLFAILCLSSCSSVIHSIQSLMLIKQLFLGIHLPLLLSTMPSSNPRRYSVILNSQVGSLPLQSVIPPEFTTL